MVDGWGVLVFFVAVLAAFLFMLGFAIAILRGVRERPVPGKWVEVIPLRRRLMDRRVWPDVEDEVREKARRRHARRHPETVNDERLDGR